jgi:hypothetical protein
MGWNDEIHCATGWSLPPASPAARRTIDTGQATAVLRAPRDAVALRLETTPGPLAGSITVRVRDRWMWSRDDAARYADVSLPVTGDMVVPLARTPPPGTEVEVVLEPDASSRGLAVRRIALES